MNERSQVYVATVVGSVLGAIAGYLFFTAPGRELRRKIEPAVEDFTREVLNLRGAVARARGLARDGWSLMDELVIDTSRQTRPF